jgi:8-oxo-dGTP pyrophosphatase MutT (NUDIX family)
MQNADDQQQKFVMTAGADAGEHRGVPDTAPHQILELLRGYRAQGQDEIADVERVRALAEQAGNPWSRSVPLHLTASALIVHPESGQVLLRWHQRQQAWLQVGGHGDPGESDALMIALREAREETGLADLAPWPDGSIRQVVIVSVPAAGTEPAHEHADVRFILATRTPGAIRAENPDAPLRWLPLREAHDLTSEANLRELLARVRRLLDS